MGNRACRTEQNGRSVTWSFDGIYRLTGETITNDPAKVNGTVSYGLDPVGNRLTETSSLQGINSGSFSYNADDELTGELYDADGNVTETGGKTFTYDSQNELTSINGGAVSIQYDGDGNRVVETASGVTTKYLVDDLNPTGYAQVVEETVNGAPEREYTYGLQRIDEDQIVNSDWTPSYFGYDGFGTVRQLTNSAGAVTDTWEYDAFGNVLNHTGSTSNEMLYRGEAFDSNLGLYYLRARWMNPITGRFLSRDTVNGDIANPPTLHKYLYAGGDPVNRVDPTGRSLGEDADLDQIPLQSDQEVKEVGEDVACQLKTDAAVLADAVPAPGEVLEELVPEGASCTAEVKKCTLGGEAGTVVIGEGMDRIIEFAKANGYGWFTPSAPGLSKSALMSEDKNWINQVMEEECDILDAGVDPRKENWPDITSDFYRLEKIEVRGYPRIKPISLTAPEVP